MNRHFKKKVIDMVCDRVPSTLQLGPDQVLIVDYRCVIEYAGGTGCIPTPLTDMVPMGESDVKFARYVRKYGNALVHAIDGDYLMIALLYYCSSDRLAPHNRIHIYRQLASPLDAECTVSKRTITGASKPVSKKPPMCWVDVQMLYCVIHSCMRQGASAQLISSERTPANDQQLVRSAVFFMLLAGTDFSRPLPLLGPKRLWTYLPDVMASLVAATAEGELVADLLYDGVVAAMYAVLFEKHVVRRPRGGAVLCDVLRQLQASALSQTTKGRLPALEQVECTAKNIQWVVKYWETVNGHVETPLSGENGYVRAPHTRGVMFADATVAV